MKLIPLLLLPLAACGPHVYVKESYHVEVDRSDRAVDHGHAPDHGGNDGGHNGGSSDNNGDVSDE